MKLKFWECTPVSKTSQFYFIPKTDIICHAKLSNLRRFQLCKFLFVFFVSLHLEKSFILIKTFSL